MEKTWLENYVLLMLRVDKIFKANDDFYVDAYIGPSELQKRVEQEDVKKASKLIQAVDNLLKEFPSREFNINRSNFLQKHLQAVKTILQILDGQKLSLKEQVESILDIEYKWVDESHFEKGLEYFKEGLPGRGDLIERYSVWNERNVHAFQNSKEKFDYIDFIIKEMRERSNKIINLPDEENINLEIVTDKRYGASTRYLGNLVSLVEINDDIPFNFFQLLPLITHELYPGHHTEFCLKEEHLINEKNYFESNIFLLTSPQLVISEGIGEVAFDMLFTLKQAAEWMITNIYDPFEIKVSDTNLEALIQASRYNSLDQVSSNAAIMLDQGEDEKEVKNYIKKYTLQPEYMLDHTVKNLKSSSLKRVYSFTYYHGKKLVQDYLNNQSDKTDALNYLMKNQLYPSLIKK